LAAPSASACCSSDDISGSKLRTTPPRIWYDRPLIAENHFRDPRGNDADAKLARVITFDNGDIRVTNAVFDFLAHHVCRFAALLDESVNRYAGDTGG
jgi:hypothetical protein